VKFAATNSNNYWSPLACLVEEQEELLEPEETNTSVDWAMNATTDIGPTNRVAAHWARKINNRTLRKMGILDTGATSGAAPERSLHKNFHVPRQADEQGNKKNADEA
jgi:hypothetical protein